MRKLTYVVEATQSMVLCYGSSSKLTDTNLALTDLGYGCVWMRRTGCEALGRWSFLAPLKWGAHSFSSALSPSHHFQSSVCVYAAGGGGNVSNKKKKQKKPCLLLCYICIYWDLNSILLPKSHVFNTTERKIAPLLTTAAIHLINASYGNNISPAWTWVKVLWWSGIVCSVISWMIYHKHGHLLELSLCIAG